jgi:arylsulfatase A-like enzyme
MRFIRAPWISASVGARTSVLAELVDVFPTMADLVGIPLPKGEVRFSSLSLHFRFTFTTLPPPTRWPTITRTHTRTHPHPPQSSTHHPSTTHASAHHHRHSHTHPPAPTIIFCSPPFHHPRVGPPPHALTHARTHTHHILLLATLPPRTCRLITTRTHTRTHPHPP